ncbi:MAG: hypothetical protein P9C48_14260 [Defluviicoccus sp.]|nr:hypothetical protein [Defluviicoccus sp.]MDG4610282.1 hypothetical protein [Defluviicoccus sp.]
MTGIRLTVDAADNLAFKRRVEDALAVTEAKLGERLNLPLLARSEAGDVAQVVLIEADEAGRIRRHYLNSDEPVSLGLSWRQGGDGEMRLAASDRHVGSVAKAALAVLLGAEDQTSARYCNQRTADGQIHNWDGDVGVASCDTAAAWHTVGDVFGRSLNLPLLWRLRRLAIRRRSAGLLSRERAMITRGTPAQGGGSGSAKRGNDFRQLQPCRRTAVARSVTDFLQTLRDAWPVGVGRPLHSDR